MNKALKIIMWIVIANIAVIPLILLLNGTGAVPERSNDPVVAPPSQPEAVVVDLTTPGALKSYREENAILIRRLGRSLDPIMDFETKKIAAFRGAEGEDCDMKLWVASADETSRRSSIFPIPAIQAMEPIPDGDGLMNSNVLRIHITQTNPDFRDVPAVMLDNPSSPSRAETSDMIPYLDMPHSGPKEREATERALRNLKARCEKIAAAES